jgi:hypothetical protein
MKYLFFLAGKPAQGHLTVWLSAILISALLLNSRAAAQKAPTIETEKLTDQYLNNRTTPTISARQLYANDTWNKNRFFVDITAKTSFQIQNVKGNCIAFGFFSNFVNFKETRQICVTPPSGISDPPTTEAMIQLKGKWNLIYAYHIRKKNEKHFFAQEISPAFEKVGDPRPFLVVADFDGRGAATVVKTSPGNKKVAIINGSTKIGAREHHVYMLNDDLKPEWDKLFDLDGQGVYRLVRDIVFDDAGNMYAYSVNLLEGNAEGRTSKGVLYAYDKNAGSMSQTNVSEEKDFGARLVSTSDGALAISAIKSDGGFGYLILRANKGKWTPIGKGMLTDSKWINDRLVIEHILLEGNRIYFSTSERYYNGELPIGAASHVVAWENKEIWQHVVNKDQRAQYSLNGHHLLMTSNGPAFLYNDHPDNVDAPITQVKRKNYTGGSTAITVFRFTRSGDVTKQIVQVFKTQYDGTAALEDGTAVPVGTEKFILGVAAEGAGRWSAPSLLSLTQ